MPYRWVAYAAICFPNTLSVSTLMFKNKKKKKGEGGVEEKVEGWQQNIVVGLIY